MFSSKFLKSFSLVKNFYNYSHGKQSLLLDLKPILPQTVRFQHQTVVKEANTEEIAQTRDVIKKVNDEIHEKSYGRLFAVVQLCGKQFKITDEDLIVVEGNWPPTAGDKIRLEKVLLVGSANFTLIGRPLLPKDQVTIYATVIEKTLSPTILWFAKIRRKRFKKTILNKVSQTFIRINSIEVNVGVDEIGDVDGARDRIF